MTTIKVLTEQLAECENECACLRKENEQLKQKLADYGERTAVDQKIKKIVQPKSPLPASTSISLHSPVEHKIELFRNLFRGREDVYPVLWQAKDGRKGYTPACKNEWDKVYCNKKKVKCGQCKNRILIPLSDQTIFNHLAGKHTIGVYPLLEDETCWFLAVDFDKKEWQSDSAAFLDTCNRFEIPAVIERSRSGNGGHVWIFFKNAVSAALARKLGFALLTLTMDKRHQIGLKSYDRFFPNQDTMPRGGFGNLIALPLQKIPREQGNSVFLDDDFQPYQDQWSFLATIKKIPPDQLVVKIKETTAASQTIQVGENRSGEETDDAPWTLPPSGKTKENSITGPLPDVISIIQANMLFIPKKGLPPALYNRLFRIAAFPNPEFYKAQAMHLSTYGKPPIISCAEEYAQHIALPRGCLDDVRQLLGELDISLQIEDKRSRGKPIKASFKGKLRKAQRTAVKNIRSHDIGILSAATAFGKTVVAAKLIAVRKRNTLVLVHRRQLLDQWHEKLAMFLSIPQEEIGIIGGGKRKPTNIVDIGIVQSLHRNKVVDDIVAEYGHIIIDECHHLAPFTFEQIMKKIQARYVLGLTATLTRKDGHHPIVTMQTGPVLFQVEGREAALSRSFEHFVYPQLTDTLAPEHTEAPSIQEIYKLLVDDEQRNVQIANDVIQAVRNRRSPLLLTERTAHLQKLQSLLEKEIKNIIVLKGGMGQKQRKEVMERLEAIPPDEERVIIATGRYIGEGFDDSRLDTLFLTMPISWKGTLQQYAGRLHRDYDSKKEVLIYDYVDGNIPMLQRMYKKRLTGYKAIGYEVVERLVEDDNIYSEKQL